MQNKYYSNMPSMIDNDSFKISPVIYAIFIVTILIVGVGSYFAGRMSIAPNTIQTETDESTQIIQPTKTSVVMNQPTIKKCTKPTDCGKSEMCDNGACVATSENKLPESSCKANADCATGMFCYQAHCYQQYYCRTNADCEIGGACQAPCTGKSCASAETVCGIRTKLNTEQNQIDDSRGCMAAACRKPDSVLCIDNQCTTATK